MKADDVTYLTEDPAPDYTRDIEAARTTLALRRILADWSDMAADAVVIAERMSDEEFSEFRDGLKKERSGIFAGETWAQKYSAILMPERMFRASMVAQQFHVPWGTAFIRLAEEDTR